MSCQQVPTAPAFNPYPRSVQVGEFEVAIGGGIWVAIGDGWPSATPGMQNPAKALGFGGVFLWVRAVEGPATSMKREVRNVLILEWPARLYSPST